MHAEIARRYTEQANSLPSRMDKIINIIRKSANNGMDFVILESIDEDCKNALLDLGYQIYFDDREKIITVEW